MEKLQRVWKTGDPAAPKQTGPLPYPGSRGLHLSAKSVEDAAYELAGTISSELISDMIVIASDLERLANLVDRQLIAQKHGKKAIQN